MSETAEHVAFAHGKILYEAWLEPSDWTRAGLAAAEMALPPSSPPRDGEELRIYPELFLNNYPRSRVRLKVSGTHLYGRRAANAGYSDAISAPLLMAILAFRSALEDLEADVQAGCDPDEYGDVLDLRRTNDDVDIFSEDTGEFVVLKRASLLADVFAVESLVKRYVANRLPALRSHAVLGAWFRGESDRLPWE